MITQRTTGIFLCLVLVGSIGGQSVNAADEFGRFFTTPSQREKLNELRKIEPELRVKVNEDVLLVKEDPEPDDEPEVDALTVQGLVYRDDGKNTAWINNSNSFEGGLSSQYIHIGNIESSKVEIKIPTAETAVKLNVGETFDPVSESYRDLIDKSTSTAIKSKSINN